MLRSGVGNRKDGRAHHDRVSIEVVDSPIGATLHATRRRRNDETSKITAGLDAKTVSRPVTPYEVAQTLANVLGVRPPSGSIGNPLTEVVGN